MAWCDPCAADPLTPGDLRQFGVFWSYDGPTAGVRLPRAGGMVAQALEVSGGLTATGLTAAG
jgi:hypothetical protein